MQTRLDLYQKVTPLAGLGIWEYNLITKNTYWNTIMWQIYEMQPQVTPPHEHIATLYRDEQVLHQLVGEAVSTLLPQAGEFKITTYKGNPRWVKLRVHAAGEAGNCTQLYGTLEDITYRKAQEEERKATLQLLSEQNSRLMNFAHIVSHNLRTHTGNIKMLAELVQQETDEKERNSMQGMLIRQATNLLESLNQLNDVVDMNSRSFDHEETLNLRAVASHVLQILERPISEYEVEVSLFVPADLFIYHKAAYLESILTNLILNAIKYCSPARPCKIIIRAKQTSEGVILEIEDNGLGIDLAKYGSKLFGLYNTFHDHPDAHGVGLYLVRSQVEALDGHIEVESEPDHGTLFRIYFKC